MNDLAEYPSEEEDNGPVKVNVGRGYYPGQDVGAAPPEAAPTTTRSSPTPQETEKLVEEANGSDAEEEEGYKQQTLQGEELVTEVEGGGASEEAVLDLAELEQLHQEAERMKGLGNKHMAAQEYTRAYNAYSAALQLSPVGPSSHVFLSNRAAALLSLKRYSAAAVDARRAVALAPTFGKAHARLGQALYFMKDYAGSVASYEDAVKYEPDNAVTWTYLAKAKSKLAKVREAEEAAASAAAGRRSVGGNDAQTVATADSTQMTAINSIATDPNGGAAVVTAGGGLRTESTRLREVVESEATRGLAPTTLQLSVQPKPPLEVKTTAMNRAVESVSPTGSAMSVSPRSLINAESFPEDENQQYSDADPDLEEALRLQRRATHFLTHKQYRAAIEEFSAALFLIPDDPVLSPQLYLGRAQALNGSGRHESARNDARMALGLNPTSTAAYSVLARSLFYAKDYAGAVEAFNRLEPCLAPGETISLVDQAYREKALAAVMAGDGVDGNGGATNGSGKPSNAPIPKLKPPRFVPREQVITSNPNLPPMPKQWPQQSLQAPGSLAVGPERSVLFLSESMGVKLNRGSDGVVRVIAVTPSSPGSPIARSGDVAVGDIVREAAGVDMRRPITNIMWGDTVALIKLAPRPVTLVVAKEMSAIPKAAADEMAKAANDQFMSEPVDHRPSFASGEEGVAESMAANGEEEATAETTASMAGGDVASPDKESDTNALDGLNAAKLNSPPASPSSTRPNVVTNGEESDVASGDFDLPPEAAAAGDEIVEAEIAKDHVKVTPEVPLAVDETVQEEPAEVRDDTVLDEEERGKDDPISQVGATGDGVADDAPEGPESEIADLGPVDEERMIEVSQPAEEVPIQPDGGDRAAVENADNEVAIPADGIDLIEAAEERQTQDADVTEEEMNQAGVTGKIPTVPERDREIHFLEGEVLFPIKIPAPGAPEPSLFSPAPQEMVRPSHGWTNEKWLATSATRTLEYTGTVCQLVRSRYFWSGEQFVARKIALFRDPDLILILRKPKDVGEVRELLALPKDLEVANTKSARGELINQFLVAETVVDSKTCKLRLSQLTTVGAASLPPSMLAPQTPPPNPLMATEKTTPRRQSCFELETPLENVVLSAVLPVSGLRKVSYVDSEAHFDTAACEAAISKYLFVTHNAGAILSSDTDHAWRHQIVLGTLHSHVVSGKFDALENALEEVRASEEAKEKNKKKGDWDPSRDVNKGVSVLDKKDESGMTPLHYACTRRSRAAVRALVKAGANVSIPTSGEGKYPCHLSAERLDEKSLSIILAATIPSRPDPNAIDSLGRTPMYVAAVHGQTVGGGKDQISLGLCLSALEAWGGQMVVAMPDGRRVGSPSPLPHPVHEVASRWGATELPAVLAHSAFRFPLVDQSKPDGKQYSGISLSALCHYPIHSALVTLRRRIMDVREDNGSAAFDQLASEPALVSTLRVLLEHGFEPNERLAAVACDSDLADELNSLIGLTPLQVLAVAAQDAHNDGNQEFSLGISIRRMKEHSSFTMRNVMFNIAAAAEILVRNGARISVDAPPTARLRKGKEVPEDGGGDGTTRKSKLPPIDRSQLKIDSNKMMVSLVGGEDRLKVAWSHWTTQKSVATNDRLMIMRELPRSGLLDWPQPGGSDTTSCAICWKAFGMMTNRKQVCHVTKRYVCDECSSKRVVDHGQDYRISDGQYLLAKMEAEKAEKEEKASKGRRRPSENEAVKLRRGSSSSSIGSLGSLEESREELFGGIVSRSVKSILNVDETSDRSSSPAPTSKKANADVGGISTALGRTRDALNERGTKLSSLGDKTAALADASEEFAKMAKELEESQRGGLFW